MQKFILKKTIFVLSFLMVCNLFISNPLKAQDERLDDFTFESEEMEDPKQPYFALSIGVTGNLLFTNYDELNNKFIAPKNMELFEGPMFTLGFNVFTALSPFVNNVRLGISYNSGSKLTEMKTVEESIETNSTRNLSMQMTGIHFDYAFVPFKSFAILPGIGINLGNMKFEEFNKISSPVSWNDIKATENNQLNYSFMAVEPQVNLEYALTGFLMLRAGVSYIASFDNPLSTYAWTINGNNELKDVPSDINPKGLNVKLGIFLGLFNY